MNSWRNSKDSKKTRIVMPIGIGALDGRLYQITTTISNVYVQKNAILERSCAGLLEKT